MVMNLLTNELDGIYDTEYGYYQFRIKTEGKEESVKDIGYYKNPIQKRKINHN